MRQFDGCDDRQQRPHELGLLTRGTTLSGYADLALSLGLNPVRMFQLAKLPPDVLSDPHGMVSADAVGRLLEESARQSGQEAFGLMLSERRRLSNLGTLGLLIREEPTLRAAIETLVRYTRLQNRALAMSIESIGQFSLIHLSLKLQNHENLRQGVEMAAGVVVRTLNAITHGAFAPARVCFVHGRPANLDVHHRVLGPEIDFAQAFNAIVCRSRDLDMPIPDADPAITRTLKEWMDLQLGEAQRDPFESVRWAVRTLLPHGSCSVDSVATYLNTNRRALNRRLATSGQSVSSVIDGVRVELAKTYLLGQMHSHQEIGHLLGFASGAEFSRWFRGHFGMTASQWEAECKSGALPAAPAPGSALSGR